MAAMIKWGDRVHHKEAGAGTVLFVGTVHFMADVWVGVALDEPHGKNDGTIKDVRYFTCPPDHGLLVRPSALTRLDPLPVRRAVGCSLPVTARSSTRNLFPQTAAQAAAMHAALRTHEARQVI